QGEGNRHQLYPRHLYGHSEGRHRRLGRRLHADPGQACRRYGGPLAGETTPAGKVRRSHAGLHHPAEYSKLLLGHDVCTQGLQGHLHGQRQMMPAALDTSHDSVVSLKGIWKSFGGLSVLKDVSIELRRSEIHVLLGENGAGKSTLVNVMIGVHAPDRGEVRLHAKPVDDLNPFVARQLGVNAVMQDFSLAPAMTVAENYFLGREQTRGPFLRKGEMRAAAHAAIQSLGVAIDVDTP